MQQLSNPGLQSRHKELLGSIIKFSQQQVMQSAPSPRNRLIIPPPQQLRISPLPPNGMKFYISNVHELHIYGIQ